MANTAIKQSVRDELQRIDEDCKNSSKSHFAAAVRWGRYHYLLGIPAVCIGASASAAFFRNYPDIGGALAVAAAILTALQTFIKPADRAALHKAAGAGYLALKNDARVFREIKLIGCEDDEATASVGQLNERRNQLNESSPQPSARDWANAVKGIRRGEAVYEVDRGRF